MGSVAGAVLDEDLLAQRLRQPPGNDARDDVWRATRGLRHDHPDRDAKAKLCPLAMPGVRTRRRSSERNAQRMVCRMKASNIAMLAFRGAIGDARDVLIIAAGHRPHARAQASTRRHPLPSVRGATETEMARVGINLLPHAVRELTSSVSRSASSAMRS